VSTTVRNVILSGFFDSIGIYQAVSDKQHKLAQQSDRWALALESGKLLAAVNQTLVSMQHPVRAGDEVAFFPPVTGG